MLLTVFFLLFSPFLVICLLPTSFSYHISTKYFCLRPIGLTCHVTKYSRAEAGPQFSNCVRCKKDLKNSKHNSLHLRLKYAWIFVLAWTKSVPRSLQFTLGYALGKLFTSQNRYHPRTNILGHFCTKWRLLFICYSFCLCTFSHNCIIKTYIMDSSLKVPKKSVNSD